MGMVAGFESWLWVFTELMMCKRLLFWGVIFGMLATNLSVAVLESLLDYLRLVLVDDAA